MSMAVVMAISINYMAAPYLTDFDEWQEARIARICEDQHEFPDLVFRWCGLVATYWPEEWVHWVLHTIDCESDGKPEAKNGSHYGLLQHTTRYWDGRALAAGWEGHHPSEPEANIAVSAHLLLSERERGRSGTSHWTCKASHAVP
jgi:hypothetical protein